MNKTTVSTSTGTYGIVTPNSIMGIGCDNVFGYDYRYGGNSYPNISTGSPMNAFKVSDYITTVTSVKKEFTPRACRRKINLKFFIK